MATQKLCKFCGQRIQWIDYKNVKTMRPFLDRFGRIKAKYYTGTCLQHQKQLSVAVKRSRIMALLPFSK
ncbi:MAG: 30S ribosomal protein S18 [Candidatus Gracilibacteria bacterium]